MRSEDTSRAHLAGCGNCGCVGRRIPAEENTRWSFDGAEGVTVCRDSVGVVVHYDGVGEE